MSDLAIRVENLTKKFYLGERVGIKTFREALQDLVTAPFRAWKRNGNGDGQEKVDTDREIWALKGVSFEVKHGEVLGIIGPNGAGKSTLLKILSRITEPTGGYAEIRGRVGSLLEVGTGFHPELTGRENVYLNGAILGMSKAEIRRKFDDIVSFAGVEKFIDTPVKRYSSGMQVRLAFAVAAHLDPEILIIDEVLAVGDAEFQKRCLGKMDEVSRSGRTVLFVSHNMAAVEGLCTRAILLQQGKVRVSGGASKVIREYLESSFGRGHESDSRLRALAKCRHIRDVRFVNDYGQPVSAIPVGSNCSIVIDVCTDSPLRNVELAIRFLNSRGDRVQTCHTRFQYPESIHILGAKRFCCRLYNCRLMPGLYRLHVLLTSSRQLIDVSEDGLVIEVTAADIYHTGRILPNHTGVILPEVEWLVSEPDVQGC